jgi:hypothetical protein
MTFFLVVPPVWDGRRWLCAAAIVRESVKRFVAPLVSAQADCVPS